MATMQAIIDRARVLLQDASKVRYTDPECLGALNDGIKMAKRLRPDLFFGQYGTPYADLALGGTFPLPPEYEPAAIKALVFWSDAREDEYANEGRGAAFLAMFEKDLLA
jgi:hypothetical protein